MRFTTIDPIVKGIVRATQTVVASEVSVLSTDSEITSLQYASLEETPQEQRNLSRNIIPDYTFYSLASRRSMKAVCGLVEVKKSACFNDNAICQTIGYYITKLSGGR